MYELLLVLAIAFKTQAKVFGQKLPKNAHSGYQEAELL